MANPLGKPSDKADRSESPVPLGCDKMRHLRRCAPRLRSPGYDLRRAPRIHPHFARNAIRGGLNQRFLSAGVAAIAPRFTVPTAAACAPSRSTLRESEYGAPFLW